MEQMTHFIKELTTPTKMLIDGSIGGILREKIDEKRRHLLRICVGMSTARVSER